MMFCNFNNNKNLKIIMFQFNLVYLKNVSEKLFPKKINKLKQK